MLCTLQRHLLPQQCSIPHSTVESNSRCCWPLMQCSSVRNYRDYYMQRFYKAAAAVVQLSGIFWLLCAALNIKRPWETGDGVRTVSATVARCPPTPFYWNTQWRYTHNISAQVWMERGYLRSHQGPHSPAVRQQPARGTAGKHTMKHTMKQGAKTVHVLAACLRLEGQLTAVRQRFN
jgi:hypothetical protein